MDISFMAFIRDLASFWDFPESWEKSKQSCMKD